MLYEITRETRARLAARGVPFPVVYGPEPNPDAVKTTRIVIERDRENGDAWLPTPTRAHKVTESPATTSVLIGLRGLGAVARIYAQSTLPGAAVHDHERLADHLADQLFAALRYVVQIRRNHPPTVEGGKLLGADELEQRGIRVWPGVVYELRVQIPRGQFDRAWSGEGQPLGTVTAVANTDEIYRQGGDPEAEPETAC